MSLSSIPEGKSIFVDSNIFLYSIFDHPEFGDPAYEFIKRVEGGEVKAFTSTLVLDEVLFKMITMEASNKLGLPLRKVVEYMKKEPEKFARLDRSWENIEKIQNTPNLKILGISPEIFRDAVALSKTHNLFPHDATHVAISKALNIKDIATSDKDFKRVYFLRVWMP